MTRNTDPDDVLNRAAHAAGSRAPGFPMQGDGEGPNDARLPLGPTIGPLPGPPSDLTFGSAAISSPGPAATAGHASAGMSPRQRIDIAARFLAGAAGGYAVSALAAILFALALPRLTGMARIEAVMTGTLTALLVWPPVMMACFHVRSAARAWTGIAFAVVMIGGIDILAGWRP